MSIDGTDLREAEFMRLVRARDFVGAHEALDRLAREHSMRESSRVGWKAHIHHIEGLVDDAIALLDPYIEVDDLPGKFMRHQRARIYASVGKLEEALADFRTLAADPTPRVVESLRVGSQFEIAYILALRGDPEFEAIFVLIPDGREQFVRDAILGKSELAQLYKANQTKVARRSANGASP